MYRPQGKEFVDLNQFGRAAWRTPSSVVRLPSARSAMQPVRLYPQRRLPNQNVRENRQGKLNACGRPCANLLEESSAAQYLDRSLKGRLPFFPFEFSNLGQRQKQEGPADWFGSSRPSSIR